MLKIVSVLSLIATAFAGGINHLIPPSPSVATLGSPYGAPLGAHLGAAYGAPLGAPLAAPLAAPLVAPYASRLVSPGLLSGVVGPSVLSLPSVAAHHVTVARPSAVAVERVDVGSVPSVSVVNEPTTIVTPGKPIRGHSFTSEVRHDTVARIAAPVYASYPSHAIAAPIVEAPAVSQLVETRHLAAPAVAAYASEAVLPSWGSTVISAPEVYATGPAQVVAAPAAVKGYTRETGRTELINEVRLRHASIPTTIYQDSVVESVPTVVEQVHEPLLASPGLLRSPLYSHLIKK